MRGPEPSHGKLPGHLKDHCATPSKPSPLRPFLFRLGLAGSWVGCTVRCNKTRPTYALRDGAYCRASSPDRPGCFCLTSRLPFPSRQRTRCSTFSTACRAPGRRGICNRPPWRDGPVCAFHFSSVSDGAVIAGAGPVLGISSLFLCAGTRAISSVHPFPLRLPLGPPFGAF